MSGEFPVSPVGPENVGPLRPSSTDVTLTLNTPEIRMSDQIKLSPLYEIHVSFL